MISKTKKKRTPAISTLQQGKRVITAVVGFTLLLLGGVLVFLPGPGFLTIVLGLAVLGTEFVWARRLLKRFKEGTNNIKNSIKNRR